MLNLLLSQIGTCANGSLRGLDNRVRSVVIDSRSVKKDALFVAIIGKNVDGHDYIEQAKMNGAAGAMVERFCESSLPQVKVKSCVNALADIAGLCRHGYSGKVIAITGSCGKTSTKEMLVSILSQFSKVSATSGNQNNEIGVPLTLMAIEKDCGFAIVELGAAQEGDIAYLMNIVEPDISVITNVGSAHIGRFGNEKTIAKTKAEIYTHLKDSAKAVINLDEKYSCEWMAALNKHEFLTFSLENKTADVFASNIKLSTGTAVFSLNYRNESMVVNLQVPGLHNVSNAVCAAACAIVAGAGMQHVVQGLNAFRTVKSRLQELDGFWGGVLIDDTYNANPASVKAAIDVLAKYKGRRYLVLGDMAELGSMSESAHADIGSYARRKAIDFLLTCGKESAVSSEVFGDRSRHFTDKQTLIGYLNSQLVTNDTVLVKGSRSAAMDEVVALLRKKVIK